MSCCFVVIQNILNGNELYKSGSEEDEKVVVVLHLHQKNKKDSFQVFKSSLNMGKFCISILMEYSLITLILDNNNLVPC